ncbi:MAG: hypothetical protein H0W89_06875 [Candidatus Levybacteria bacterium]|nr:hypothetical protein [Candidatus Levybacteria bacterium]
MDFNFAQLDKLSELFLDLAKGLFLAGIAVPVIATEISLLDSFKSMFVGLFLTYLSLRIVKLKEN